MFALRRPPRPEIPAKPPQAGPAAETVAIRDFSYSSTVRGEKVFTLTAEEVSHRRRKVGPLTLNPIQDVEMTGVRIEIVRGAAPAGSDGSPAPEVDLPIAAILSESLKSRDLGLVSRVRMNRVRLAFVRGREEQFRIVAGLAFAGLESTTLRLERGVTIRTRSGRQLEAQAAEWRIDGRRLVVPGAFVLRNGHDTLRGERGRFLFGPGGELERDE